MLLNGVRVVELPQIIAGPMAGQILAELGADVIEVERPEGDDARNWVPPTWHDSSPMFHSMNRGKRSVRLDLTTEDGRSALKRLVRDADIFIIHHHGSFKRPSRASRGSCGPVSCSWFFTSGAKENLRQRIAGRRKICLHVTGNLEQIHDGWNREGFLLS